MLPNMPSKSWRDGRKNSELRKTRNRQKSKYSAYSAYIAVNKNRGFPMTQTRRDNYQPTAMVVNDDMTQLNVLSGLLRKDGIRVQAFDSAEDALTAMDRGSFNAQDKDAGSGCKFPLPRIPLFEGVFYDGYGLCFFKRPYGSDKFIAVRISC
jgi:hypothetical protein